MMMIFWKFIAPSRFLTSPIYPPLPSRTSSIPLTSDCTHPSRSSLLTHPHPERTELEPAPHRSVLKATHVTDTVIPPSCADRTARGQGRPFEKGSSISIPMRLWMEALHAEHAVAPGARGGGTPREPSDVKCVPRKTPCRAVLCALPEGHNKTYYVDVRCS